MAPNGPSPLLMQFANSEQIGDRHVFMRVYVDYARFLRRQGASMPAAWRGAWASCLARTTPTERDLYLGQLAQESAGDDGRTTENDATCVPNAHRSTKDAAAPQPGMDELIALVREKGAGVAAHDLAALVERARHAIDLEHDRRLAEILLAVQPIRLQLAPLFLEATSDQRLAIALAAQRYELGRRGSGAIAKVSRAALERLEYAAIAGDRDEFETLLDRAIGTPRDLTKRIIDDVSGEPLAIALIAIGAPRDVCLRILTARDLEALKDVKRLTPLMRLSESLSPLAARRILSAFVHGARASGSKALAAAEPRTLRQVRGYDDVAARKPAAAQPRNVSTFGAR